MTMTEPEPLYPRFHGALHPRNNIYIYIYMQVCVRGVLIRLLWNLALGLLCLPPHPLPRMTSKDPMSGKLGSKKEIFAFQLKREAVVFFLVTSPLGQLAVNAVAFLRKRCAFFSSCACPLLEYIMLPVSGVLVDYRCERYKCCYYRYMVSSIVAADSVIPKICWVYSIDSVIVYGMALQLV